MMEEEEETLFDQEGLLGRKEEALHEKREWKHKLFKTAALSMSFFCLGLCIAIPGPTLLDLGKRVNRDIDHMTFIFTARSIGYLIGSLAGGVLFDFFDQQMLLFFTLSAVAVATASVPWCTALLALSVFICVQGVAQGVLDTGGNIFCIRIWGQKSAPFMQILHFAFGVGAFLAPLIARPFLMDTTMVFDNITKVDYYPVNFKVPSLESLSGHNRFVRHVSDQIFWDKNYRFNLETEHGSLSFRNLYLEHDASSSGDKNIGLNRTSDIMSNIIPERSRKSITIDSQLLDLKKDSSHSQHEQYSKADARLSREVEENLAINRVKRQETSLADNENSTLARNNTQLLGNETESNLTFSVTPATTTVRPRKPGHIDGGTLKKDLADSDKINKELMNLKKNPPVQNKQIPEEVTTTGTSTRDLDLSKTSVISAARALVDTDNHSEIINDTRSSGEAITVPTTAESVTTAATTIVASTAVASTTVASTTVASTSVASTTVFASTASTTIFTTPLTAATQESSPKITTIFPTELTSTSSEATDNASVTNSSTGNNVVTKSEDDDLFSHVFTAVVGMSKIQFAYSVISMLLVVNAGLFLFLYCKDRMSLSPPMTRSHEDMTRPPDTKCFVSSLIVLLFFFFFTYMGMEVTFGGLLTTFAVYYPMDHWTPVQAATLTALFWGCLALGRCFAIFIARFFKPPCMMVTNLCFTVVGAALLSFAVQVSSSVLWLGTVTLGLGMSSLFPTAISWANSYYPLTGRATAVFVAGSGVGEMVIPVMTGYLFEKVNRMALMYMTLTLSVLLSLLYLSLQLLMYRKGKSSPSRSHSGFMRLNNSEDMADAVDMDTIEFAEGEITAVTETTRMRLQVEDERVKQNGDSYKTTEFTKLVELSD